MPDTVSSSQSPSAPRPASAGNSRVVGKPARALSPRIAWAALVLSLFLMSVMLASYVLQFTSGNVVITASVLVLMVSIGALLFVGGVAREFLHWRKPSRELAKLLNEIRAGEAPMAELDKITGGPRSLVEPIRSVLLDLKEQKRLNGTLQTEMRTKILSRTDALERQLSSIKAQAARDALTGLGNRRAYESILPQMFGACRSAQQDMCVMMIDVDNFKPLNDTLGHAAGDEFLKQVGELLRSSIREHDAAFRIGGDEFVVVLPRASKPIGEKLAARVAMLVDHLARPLKLAQTPGLSIGVAALSDRKFADHNELIAQADKSLYEVKQAKPGRKPRNAA